MAEKAWMNASELSREVIQKRHLCCGFYDPAEDVRCAHLYPESCGERLIEVQSSSLKLISALIFLATMIDVLNFTSFTSDKNCYRFSFSSSAFSWPKFTVNRKPRKSLREKPDNELQRPNH